MVLFYKRYLRFVAILPFEKKDYTYLATRFLFVCGLISCLINWSQCVLYVINKPGIPTIDGICESILVSGYNIRYLLMLSRRHELAALFEQSREIWKMCRTEDRHWVQHFERKARRLFQCLLLSCLGAHFMYSTSAAYLTVISALESNGSQYQRFLPFKWFKEDGANMWPGYEYNFILEVTLLFHVIAYVVSVDTAAPVLIMIGAGYFRVIQHRLLHDYEFANEDYEDNAILRNSYRKIVACLRMHQQVLSYCANIDKIARTLFFVQLLTTSYNTSLIGIKLVSGDPDRHKYIALAMMNLSQMFVCQWAPDHLLDESEAISTAAYCASFRWMRCKFGKMLVLVIARAQRPVQMSAAGIVNLSLQNFGSMLKGALSFFTVLRNFNV